MNEKPNLCDTCPWPLECCTEEGTPRPKPMTVDCPRDHAVWDRRLGDARLAVTTAAPTATGFMEEEDLEVVR